MYRKKILKEEVRQRAGEGWRVPCPSCRQGVDDDPPGNPTGLCGSCHARENTYPAR